MILLYYEVVKSVLLDMLILIPFVNMQIETIFYTIGPTSPMQPTDVMHAIFKPVVQQGAEICMSPPHFFTKGGLRQLPG